MPKTYSVKEAATILGFSTNTIYTFLNSQKLQGIRVGKGRFRIPQHEIDRMLGATAGAVPEAGQTAVSTPPGQEPAEPIIPRYVIQWGDASIVDWFIGLGSLILGLSMFLYTASLDQLLFPQYELWYGVIRLLFIVFGLGYIVSKLTSCIPSIWDMVYTVALTCVFAWFSALSFLIGDIQGLLVGVMMVYILLFNLFAAPSAARVLAHAMLGIGVVHTVLAVFSPQLFATIVRSFAGGIEPTIGMQAAIIGLPYLAYLLLILLRRYFTNGFYALWILISLASFFGAYVSADALYWRRALFLIFAGVCLETKQMKTPVGRWLSWGVFLWVLALFFGVIASLKVFEMTMVDYTNRSLQVKAENGKLYLDLVFEYAKQTFHIQVEDKDIGAALTTRNRPVLLEYSKRVYEQFPHTYRVLILSSDGTELANYPEDPTIVGRDFSFRAYFQEVMAGGQPVLSSVAETIDFEKKPAIVLAVPIIIDGVTKGVLVGGFDLGEIGQRLQSFAADEEGEYFGVIDDKGIVMINPNKTVVGTPIPQTDFEKLLQSAYWKNHVDTRTNQQGEIVFATYRTADSANIHLTVEQPVKENLNTRFIAPTVILIMGVYGYVVILAAWFISRKLYKKTIRVP